MTYMIISINKRLVNKSNDKAKYRDVNYWKCHQEMSLAEFKVNVVQKGFSFLPGEIDFLKTEGYYSASDVNRANVLALDIDKGFRIEEALKSRFLKKHCVFAYTTCSHTDAEHKFRLVFRCVSSIYSSAQIKAALRYLREQLFPAADKACVDAGRFYFGNSAAEILFENEDAVPLDQMFLKQAVEYGMQKEHEEQEANRNVILAPATGDIAEHFLPRDEEILESILSFIPPRTPGEGTYMDCRDMVWALTGYLGEAHAISLAECHSPSEGDWSVEAIAKSYDPARLPQYKCLARLKQIASQFGWDEANARKPIVSKRMSEAQQVKRLKQLHPVVLTEVALAKIERDVLEEGVPIDINTVDGYEKVAEIAMNLIAGVDRLRDAGYNIEGDVNAWHVLVHDDQLARMQEDLKTAQEYGRSAYKDTEAWGNTSNVLEKAERWLIKRYVHPAVASTLPKGENHKFEPYSEDRSIPITCEFKERVSVTSRKILEAINGLENPWHHLYRFGTSESAKYCYPARDIGRVDEEKIILRYLECEREFSAFMNNRIKFIKIVSKQVKGVSTQVPEIQPFVDRPVILHLMGTEGVNVPFVRGIKTIPSLNKRYELIPVGYDRASRFLYDYDPNDFIFEESISLDKVKEAFAYIEAFFQEFIFETQADRSAYYAYLLTCVTRNMYDIAPMFMVSAGSSDSGKSALCNIGAMIADGSTDNKTCEGNDEELVKKLYAMLSSDRNVLVFNNTNKATSFTNSELESLITEGSLSIRKLGTNTEQTFEYTKTLIMNGNNIAPYNDFARRTIPIKISKRANRNFKDDQIVETAREKRVAMAKALLTIVLGYQQSGVLLKSEYPTAFKQWWRVACAPLVWLGQVDPMASNRVAIEQDMHGQEIEAWFNGIEELMGLESEWTLADLIRAARNQNNGLDMLDTTPLWQLILEHGTKQLTRELNLITLGKYFAKHILHKQDRACLRTFKCREVKGQKLFRIASVKF